MEPEVLKPKSFPEYIQVISKKRTENEPLWFRGMNNANNTLIPSLLRRKDLTKDEDFSELERNLIDRFRERSIPYQERNLSSEWEALFFMQHYGVPTRLLDWTENPFVALYFALIDGNKNSKNEYLKDAVVWIVNPVKWNNILLSTQGHVNGILSVEDRTMNPYKPPADYKYIPKFSVAIYGSYNSTRIVAQRGTFFIFGRPKQTMEKIYKDHFTEKCLFKIIIEKENRENIRQELLSSGITESVVFPDLDGLSKEIKRQYGF